MLLRPGFLLQNRYLIVKQIVQSSNGALYEAVDKRSRQRIAVKQCYPPTHSGAHEARAAFEHKASVLLRLTHPTLPAMLDYFLDTMGWFLVMDFVPGDDLFTVLQQRQQQPFTLNEVLHWGDHLLDALEYLHAHQEPLIHQDIKPQNLKLSARGDIILVDISLQTNRAIAADNQQATLSALQFVPPELLIHHPPDARTDLYALGATLYFLLTGEPFPSAVERALALSLGLHDPLQSVDTLNLTVPRDIAIVLQRALAHLPRHRFARAVDMRSALSARQASHTMIVAAQGEADYRSIRAALADAEPDTRILVRPGRYIESLELTQTVSIVGEGAVDTIIIESVDTPCVIMQTERAEVRGLTLRGRSVRAEQRFPAVVIGQGNLTLEDCIVTSEALAGIAIYGPDANPTIRRCSVHTCAEAGIDIYDEGSGIIEDCDVFNNTRAGIEISHRGNPLVRNCVIREGLASGIYVGEHGDGIVEECTISGNARSGIAVCRSANPTIRRCTVQHSRGAGIFFYKQGRGTIEECAIIHNTAAGIEIKERSAPVIQGCTVHGGLASGIYVHEEGMGTISACSVYANAFAGLTIATRGAPTVRTSQIYDGHQEGVWVTEEGGGVLENCDIYSNAHANISIGQVSSPTIRRCQVRNGKQAGILVTENGNGHVTDCDITSHVESGIVVATRGTLTLFRCRIKHNGAYGVVLHKNGSGTVQECDLRDNALGAWQYENRKQIQNIDNTV